MTLHFQLGKYDKIKFLILKLCPSPMADSLRILQKRKKTHTHTIMHTHRHQDYCFLSLRDGARGATYKHLIKNQVQLLTLGNRE